MARYGWKFPSIEDTRFGQAGKLGINGHPAVVLVDEQGGVVGGFFGEGDEADWEELAARL